MKREQLAQLMIYLAVFLLPWQTHWIYSELTLQGEIWEYGKLGIYATQVLIVLGAVLLGRPQYETGHKKITGLAVIFLGAGFLSVSTSLNSTLATGAMLPLVVAVMLFMILLDKRVKVEQTAMALVLGLLLPSFLGWWQVANGWSPASTWLGLAFHDAQALGQSVVELADGQRILRAYGSLAHPNIFGGYLALGILLAGWLLTRVKDKYQQRLLGGALVILMPTLVVTFSRSAWLALFIGAVVWLGWSMLKKQQLPKSVWRFGLAAFLLVVLSAGAFWPVILTRVQPQTRLEVKSMEERGSEYGQWAEIFRMNKLTGVGPGNYTWALAELHPNQPVWAYQPMHNGLLLMVAEIGLFGLAVLAWWWRHILYNLKSGWSWGAVLALMPLIVLDHYLWSSWSGVGILAIFLGFLIRLQERPKET